MPQTTIKQLLQQAYERIDPLDAELIIAFVLKKTREFVLAHGERKIERLKDRKITRLLREKTRGVPLAYLTGHKEFFGLDFIVDKNVLIPRPETEVLVENVLSECRMQITGGKKIVLIDAGTGSGCIPIAIIKTLKHKNIKTFVVDISKGALRIAKANAKKHRVKIKLLHCNLLAPFFNTYSLTNLHTYTLIITANLPYLTSKQHKQSPTIQYEPKSALIAGKTGLELYEKLLKQVRSLISNIKYPISIFFEIDPSQSRRIIQLIKKYLPDTKVKIKKDLSGKDRVIIISDF